MQKDSAQVKISLKVVGGLLFLTHPELMLTLGRVIDRGVCTQAPCYCIVMEYCPNGQLYDVLHNNRVLSPAMLVSWAQQIAAGMSYVHSHKIIHRDLKSPKLAFKIHYHC